MAHSEYTEAFYTARDKKTRYAALQILSIAAQIVPPIRSAVDVGCGVGTWLSVLQSDFGVQRVCGFDGEWVDTNLLEIDPASFRKVDLRKPIAMAQRFDIAICLEVAEHLPSTCAAEFVQTLSNLSDFVLFSAAIPGQGGVEHLNEQWPDYWCRHFATCGYSPMDLIRAEIWNDNDIPTHYRQNCILFVQTERSGEVKIPSRDSIPSVALPLVHPNAFIGRLQNEISVRATWSLFARSLRNAMRRRLSPGSRPQPIPQPMASHAE